MRRILILLTSLTICAACLGQERKFEVRAGWGDQMFETLVCHEKAEPFGLLPADKIINVNSRYRYSQHWFAEGQYKALDWLGVGAMVDFSNVSWENSDYDGTGRLLKSNGRKYFSNISVMPSVTFTYFNRKHVQLHSSVAMGLNINTGNEKDYKGRFTAFAPAIYLNFIGVRGVYDRYFASVDLGALMAMNGQREIYLLGSRLVSVSAGLTF